MTFTIPLPHHSRRHLSSLLPGIVLGILILSLTSTLLFKIAGEAESASQALVWFEPYVVRVSLFTGFQASLSTALSLMAGLLLAWALGQQQHFAGRQILLALLASALVLPALVVVLSLVGVFGRTGWLNETLKSLSLPGIGGNFYGLGGILAGHVYLNAAFAARVLLHAFDAIPPTQRKLAQSLDLSPWQRFRAIEWPAVRTTLPGLGAVIFLLCFTSFAIVLTLGGSPAYNTLEVAIYEAVRYEFDLQRAVHLALIQLLVCVSLALLAARAQIFGKQIETLHPMASWPEPPVARVVQWSVIILFSMFFIAPLVALSVDALRADLLRLVQERALQRALFTSLLIGAASALMTLLCTIAIAAARTSLRAPTRFGRAGPGGYARLAAFLDNGLAISATLYLAMPAMVFGLGSFLLVRDLGFTGRAWPVAVVIGANTLLTLPFALAIMFPACNKIAARYDRLAFSLDLAPMTRWRYVEWPLLRAPIATIVAVSFCMSLGDLGVIALFGSQDFATLPWYLLQKMGTYRTHDGAGVAFIMLLLIIAVLIFLPRMARQTRCKGGVS